MAEEEVAVVAGSVSPVPSDHKRKLEDLEPQEAEEEPEEEEPEELSPGSDGEARVESANGKSKEDDDAVPDAKRPRLEDGSDSAAVENGHEEKKEEAPQVENVQHPTEGSNFESAEGASVENSETKNVDDSSMEDLKEENPQMGNIDQPMNENSLAAEAQQTSVEESHQPTEGVSEQGDLASAEQDASEAEEESVSRKMEVPNNKVGVLIGKAGDTIRFLQFNSGAKIQITRDAEADPSSSTRPVELIGSLENINKAEKLIKDVIAEADAGGSPSLVARGFGTIQPTGAAEQIQIHVPNEKVGLIIGKGGDTIKNLQTRSGARIQLIPQHAPEGDQSKDRLVRVSGDKKQIEIATEMIKEVMSQPVRQSPLSGGYNQQQQNNRPRGSTGPGHWGPRGPPSGQGSGYDYQRGMYPSQNQYMSQSYGGYPSQHSGPRGNFNAGWDQRSSGHMQGPPSQSSGYDHYGQGGHGDGPVPGPISNAGPHGSAPSVQGNYNYGQPQGMDYGQPNTYSQTGPLHNYSHGYEDPKYPHQGPAQPGYGGRGSSQPGAYPQQANHPGYPQQPYNKPAAYNMPAQGPPQAYAMPRTSQHGEMPYQGPNPANPQYGSNMPAQQGYPYPSGGPAQQNYPYGSAPVAADGYNQAPPHGTSTAGYPQQGAQPVPGYGQPGVQPTTGYAQGAGQAGYGSYPTQPGYGEPVANNASYGGYQGPADAGYNSGAPAAAYGAQPVSQAGYVQPTPNQHAYEQPIPQAAAAYGNVPGGTAPAGYAKNVSPQPTAYNQYDATQMYGAQH